jgi:hypothetical protein
VPEQFPKSVKPCPSDRVPKRPGLYRNAGAQLRTYLALALAGTPEAVSLAEKNLQFAHSGADAHLYKGRQRTMIYQVVFGAALSGLGRYGEAERQLRAALDDNRDSRRSFFAAEAFHPADGSFWRQLTQRLARMMARDVDSDPEHFGHKYER